MITTAAASDAVIAAEAQHSPALAYEQSDRRRYTPRDDREPRPKTNKTGIRQAGIRTFIDVIPWIRFE